MDDPFKTITLKYTVMDIKELRIGNYLKCQDDLAHGEVLEICYIGNHGRPTINGWDIKEWSPILLTPEILEKAGFEKKEYSYIEYKKWIGEFGFSFEYRIIKGSKGPLVEFVLCGNGGYDEAGEMSILETCKYVHQLQNLYFALTGTQL